MKHTALFLLLLFAYSHSLSSQTSELLLPNSKFGKPTSEELSMAAYPPDSSAAAVVLYKHTHVKYDFINNGFRLTYRYKTRIKVLKDEGTEYANITIPYYEKKSNRLIKEAVTGLSASAYNVEDGKLVRTKMKKDQVFEERVNDNYMQTKFSIPQVKAGTIIEYEYQILSDLYYRIRDWSAQEAIPTLYTEYEVTIPEYFQFNVENHGMARLEQKRESATISFTINGQMLQCSGTQYFYSGRQLPAIKDDDYVWCPENYSAQVNLELQGIQIPGAVYENYTQTWEQIDKMLLEDSDFGGRLKMNNPLKDEMAAMKLEQMDDNEQKICALFQLLNSKVKWNERYTLYGNNGRQTLKEGTGSNADLNFIFISMLKDAGIQAYPVVMNRRDQPIIPYAYPSIQRLSTFIVGIANTDSTLTFIDASVRDGYLNTLPSILITDRARLIASSGSRWINLQEIGRNITRCNVIASITPDGTISGTRETSYTGQNAADLRKEFRTAKDSADFIQKLCNRENMEIKKYNVEGIYDFSPTVQEQLDFTKHATVNDSYIYVNPLIFLHTLESPFKQSERVLPIEFNYPDQLTLTVSLIIPEGYTVDELPKPSKMATSEGKISMLYYPILQGNKIILRYSFQLKQLLYAPASYPELKLFWEKMAEINNAMMILKKEQK